MVILVYGHNLSIDTASVGASLLANASGQSTVMLNVPASSRASSLPQGFMVVCKLCASRQALTVNQARPFC
ncbi:hypothetical protein CXF97_24685 [Pseudomonas sp. Choline-02u-1]|nr:hypothetical protein CXF97_24685 [Pseudomonas sp. Choline-02u-1]